jgi:hypothetical protein
MNTSKSMSANPRLQFDNRGPRMCRLRSSKRSRNPWIAINTKVHTTIRIEKNNLGRDPLQRDLLHGGVTIYNSRPVAHRNAFTDYKSQGQTIEYIHWKTTYRSTVANLFQSHPSEALRSGARRLERLKEVTKSGRYARRQDRAIQAGLEWRMD